MAVNQNAGVELCSGTALRRETHQQALAIEARLVEVWASHPCRVVINGASDFMEKSRRALAALEQAMGPHECIARGGSTDAQTFDGRGDLVS